MSEKMSDEQINKIAQALAAKLAQPGGPGLLGCGSASSTQYYYCSSTYSCGSYYGCGGAADFACWTFTCHDQFRCYGIYGGCLRTFDCQNLYSEG